MGIFLSKANILEDEIVKLPEKVINQIAAGEVIERPSSVVKELIENSIDAKSKNIKIYISGSGRDNIKVVDDGNSKNTLKEDSQISFDCKQSYPARWRLRA